MSLALLLLLLYDVVSLDLVDGLVRCQLYVLRLLCLLVNLIRRGLNALRRDGLLSWRQRHYFVALLRVRQRDLVRSVHDDRLTGAYFDRRDAW